MPPSRVEWAPRGARGEFCEARSVGVRRTAIFSVLTLGLLALTIVLPGGAAAQQVVNSFNGTVVKPGNPFTLKLVDNSERTVQVPPGVKVVRDNKPASVGDLQEKDKVSVYVRENGAVYQVIAAPDSPLAFGLLFWAYPLLWGAFITGFMAFWAVIQFGIPRLPSFTDDEHTTGDMQPAH